MLYNAGVTKIELDKRHITEEMIDSGLISYIHQGPMEKIQFCGETSHFQFDSYDFGNKKLFMTQGKNNETIMLQEKMKKNSLSFFFMLEGYFISHQFPGKSCPIHQGHSFISSLSDTSQIEIPGKIENKTCSVHFSTDYFIELLKDEHSVGLDFIEKKTRSFKQNFNTLIHKNIISPEVNRIINEIKINPFTGPLRNIFLEGKILEILSYELQGLKDDFLPQKSLPRLSHSERDRIYYARDILLNKMDNPPRTTEIAREVGLNDFKLKRGFKQIFGKPMFSFLREERLKKAKQLLEQGNSVTLTAMQIGYSNPSHFASAFRAYYAQNPGTFQKKTNQFHNFF